MNPLPLSAGDVINLIGNAISKTAPVSPADLYQALNYGVRKAVLALTAVRPALFGSFVDPFTIQAGVTDYDVSALYPPLLRPWKLIVDGGAGQGQVILFRYAEQTSAEFEEGETGTGAMSSQLLYEIAYGMFPGPTTVLEAPMVGGTNAFITVPGPPVGTGTGVTGFYPGAVVTIPGGGAPQSPQGSDVSHIIPTTYQGYVLQVDTLNLVLYLAPAVQAPLDIGAVITLQRQQLLRIVPRLGASYTGRLWYVYEPPRLQADAELLPAGLTRHTEMIVAYAMAYLKRTMDDPMEARWQLDATEMRSELMQDSEPASGQNTTAFGSALDGLGGY